MSFSRPEDEMRVEVLAEGEGQTVPMDAMVTMHYNGTLEDGTLFDSSYTRG